MKVGESSKVKMKNINGAGSGIKLKAIIHFGGLEWKSAGGIGEELDHLEGQNILFSTDLYCFFTCVQDLSKRSSFPWRNARGMC